MEAKEKILFPVLAFSVLVVLLISTFFKIYFLSAIFLVILTVGVFFYERERKRSYNDKLQQQKLINENISKAPVLNSYLLDSVMHINNKNVNCASTENIPQPKTTVFHDAIKLLGLPIMDSYTAIEIKQAYRKQVRIIHPDLNKILPSESATEQMVALDEAKIYLLNKHVK